MSHERLQTYGHTVTETDGVKAERIDVRRRLLHPDIQHVSN